MLRQQVELFAQRAVAEALDRVRLEAEEAAARAGRELEEARWRQEQMDLQKRLADAEAEAADAEMAAQLALQVAAEEQARLEREAAKQQMSVEAYRLAEQRARDKASGKIGEAERKRQAALEARRQAEAAEQLRQWRLWHDSATMRSGALRREWGAKKITRQAREPGVISRVAAHYKVASHRAALIRIARQADEAEVLLEVERREKMRDSTAGALELEVLLIIEDRAQRAAELDEQEERFSSNCGSSAAVIAIGLARASLAVVEVKLLFARSNLAIFPFVNRLVDTARSSPCALAIERLSGRLGAQSYQISRSISHWTVARCIRNCRGVWNERAPTQAPPVVQQERAVTMVQKSVRGKLARLEVARRNSVANLTA